MLERKIQSIRPLEETLKDIGVSEDSAPVGFDVLEANYRKTPRKTKTKRTSSTMRRLWRRKKRLPKAKAKARRRLRKPMVKRRMKLLKKWKARRNIPKRPAGRGGRVRLSLTTGNDRVSNLMEEVREIVTGLAESQQGDMIKAYALAAVLAEQLSEHFIRMAEAVVEELEGEASQDEAAAVKNFTEYSEKFENIAEEAAESAELLHGFFEKKAFAESVDESELESHFRGIMSSVLEGCDIFSYLMEEDEEEEDEDEESKPSKDSKDKDKSKKKCEGQA